MRRSMFLLVPIILGWMVAAGQVQTDSGWVRVIADTKGAAVYVDGRLVGSSPVDSLRLASGFHLVQAQRQSPYRWTAVVAAESVEVRAGTVTEVLLRVPAEVLVRTEPSDAPVKDGEVMIGRTPLRVSQDRLSSITLMLGGHPSSPQSAPDSSGVVTIRDGGGAPPQPTVMTGPGVSGLRSEAWTLTAGGTMVVSGVLAAIFRDRANAAAVAYQRTGDPQALADVRQYDRLASAGMVVVQVSLGAFVLLLTGF